MVFKVFLVPIAFPLSVVNTLPLSISLISLWKTKQQKYGPHLTRIRMKTKGQIWAERYTETDVI